MPRREVAAGVKKLRRKWARATPPWADVEQIALIYEVTRQLRDETGLDWQVDHAIPLRGKNVCGLHVHTNLYPTLGSLNARKGNKLVE